MTVSKTTRNCTSSNDVGEGMFRHIRPHDVTTDGDFNAREVVNCQEKHVSNRKGWHAEVFTPARHPTIWGRNI